VNQSRTKVLQSSVEWGYSISAVGPYQADSDPRLQT